MITPGFIHPTMQPKRLLPAAPRHPSPAVDIEETKKSGDLLSGGGLDADALEVGLESVSLRNC